MKLVRHHTDVIAIFEHEEEKGYLLAMQHSQEWVPLYLVAKVQPFAEIHTTTHVVRLCGSNQVANEQKVVFYGLSRSELLNSTRSIIGCRIMGLGVLIAFVGILIAACGAAASVNETIIVPGIYVVLGGVILYICGAFIYAFGRTAGILEGLKEGCGLALFPYTFLSGSVRTGSNTANMPGAIRMSPSQREHEADVHAGQIQQEEKAAGSAAPPDHMLSSNSSAIMKMNQRLDELFQPDLRDGLAARSLPPHEPSLGQNMGGAAAHEIKQQEGNTQIHLQEKTDEYAKQQEKTEEGDEKVRQSYEELHLLEFFEGEPKPEGEESDEKDEDDKDQRK